jgi:hypothetical protein
MPDTLTVQMLQDLREHFPQDFPGAMAKIEKWKLVLAEVEGYAKIARDHPDGWAHLAGMMGEGKE